RLLAPRPPAPSAAYPAFLPTAAAAAATGPLRAAQPLLVDLSLPRQSVWVLPVPVPVPVLTLPRTLPAPHVLPPPLAAAQYAGPELPVALKTIERRRLNAKRRAEAQPGTTLSHRAGVPQADAVASVGPAEEAGGQAPKEPVEVEKEARARRVVASHQRERETSASDSPLMANKDSLARYSCEVQNQGRCCT
ncbi:unnamed protein product, partial [Arctogadus glacialis]